MAKTECINKDTDIKRQLNYNYHCLYYSEIVKKLIFHDRYTNIYIRVEKKSTRDSIID